MTHNLAKPPNILELGKFAYVKLRFENVFLIIIIGKLKPKNINATKNNEFTPTLAGVLFHQIDNMPFHRIITTIKSNPSNLFLLDSFGAIVSAILYVAVLANFENTFGLPQKVLYFLALLACIYAVYSGVCYFLSLKNWKPFLRIIALANLTHCCLTIGLLAHYYQQLTILGLVYFVGELAIVTSLAIIELQSSIR